MGKVQQLGKNPTVYRELLLEIGFEEMPAAWLPSLTQQLGERVTARLSESRLVWVGPVSTYSTPRRLIVQIDKVAVQQDDLEEVIAGPPVSLAFETNGQPTRVALGFARKYGVDIKKISRVETPKGPYLIYKKRRKGQSAREALPGVLAAALRDLTFPKQMRWDAWLDDGSGELVFGRPIRWLLFLHGGSVVPFVIYRKPEAKARNVRDVHSAAVTYGHRSFSKSGDPGQAIEVQSFVDYRISLKDQFVLIDRNERKKRIFRKLKMYADRLQGELYVGDDDLTLLNEVTDLVEYPSVMTGTFPSEFLYLPTEVLATTIIHHQHFFPIVDTDKRLMDKFFSVTNTNRDNAQVIVKNAERVVVARLRDAKFFWEADRKISLESRLDRLDTLLFHKQLGSYQQKARRIEILSGEIATDVLGSPEDKEFARTAGRLAKTDLVTQMVGEFPELQGIMGGIYAREEGFPEQVWKAIYHHYLPVSIKASASPKRSDLGKAAVTWAAVSLADKVDTLVGLFHVGEQPSGSRDPFGLRRQAHGVCKLLVDFPELTGLDGRPSIGQLLEVAYRQLGRPSTEQSLFTTNFLIERLRYLLEERGFDIRNVRAVTNQVSLESVRPVDARRKLEVLPEFAESVEFRQLATLFKRVKNMARELPVSSAGRSESLNSSNFSLLHEPAELALLEEIEKRSPIIEDVLLSGKDYRSGFTEAAKFGPAVDRFFSDVFVMVDDSQLRTARLGLMKKLESLILQLADVSEIVSEVE